MTKKILDLSLSLFLISCALVLLSAIYNSKTFIDRYTAAQTRKIEMAASLKDSVDKVFNQYFAAIETQTQAQKDLIETSKKINSFVFEAGIAIGTRALEEEGAISPTDSNRIITQSIDNIMKDSERLGILAKALNDASRRY